MKILSKVFLCILSISVVAGLQASNKDDMPNEDTPVTQNMRKAYGKIPVIDDIKDNIQKKFITYEEGLLGNKKWTLGSIFLYDGYGLIGSLIKCCSLSPRSHISITLRRVYDDSDTDSPKYENTDDILSDTLVFESTSQGPGQLFKGILPQVQINDGKIVREYNGSVVQRNFIFEEGCEPDPAEVVKYVKGRLGTPYEKNPLRLLKSPSRHNRDYTSSDSNSMFCSELVADMLQSLGYMEKTIAPHNYTPGHFSELMESIKLVNGVSLTEEFEIQKPKKSLFDCCCIF